MDTMFCNTLKKHEYSEKINERRRSLFPPQKQSTCLVDHLSEGSDLDEMLPLGPSDNENENFELENEVQYQISNSIVMNNVLSTPKSKNYPPSEVSMSPLYLSPLGNISHGKSISSISPTKCLKTPNDSNVNTVILPKLPKKYFYDNGLSFSDQKHVASSPVHSKCSKVRTSLFPEFDIAPKNFYPVVDSSKLCFDKSIVPKKTFRRNMKTSKISKIRKKNYGQINAGVQHKIKRPKNYKSKSNLMSKISPAALAKIKTFKGVGEVQPELNGFMKNLDEWTQSKTIKLINTPDNNSLDSIKEVCRTNLKRVHSIDHSNSKKQKLEAVTNTTSLPSSPINEEALSKDIDDKSPENIIEIINMLDETLEHDKENKTEKNYESYVSQHNSESLLSPTSEMCNMASVMKIVSPKKIKNLNPTFEILVNEQKHSTSPNKEKSNQVEYFPIFNSNYQSKIPLSCSRTEKSGKRNKISSNQMLLDAGQKQFGLTECATCNYVYHRCDPNDEKLHENHHNATHILHFAGWKNEHVLEDSSGGTRVIQILPSDPKIWLEKVKKVIEVINRDMGYYDMTVDISASKVFLFIMNKTIIGCLVAECKSKGFKVLTSALDVDLCSTEDYTISCGVSRIWVNPRFRMKGVATKLMEVLRMHFVPGHVLKKCEIAFSSPTADGKLFAAKYFGTPNFLTYFD